MTFIARREEPRFDVSAPIRAPEAARGQTLKPLTSLWPYVARYRLRAFGALIALLGITSAVAVHAHTRARHGTVRLAVEVGAAVLAGMVVGSVLGTLLANRLVARLDTDLIHLVRHIAPSTYVIAWSVVVAVSALTLAASIVTLRIARAEEPERVVARA